MEKIIPAQRLPETIAPVLILGCGEREPPQVARFDGIKFVICGMTYAYRYPESVKWWAPIPDEWLKD